MISSDPKDYFNARMAHISLGGLTVLFFSPAFALLPVRMHVLVISVPVVLAGIKECGETLQLWNHESQSWKIALVNWLEWQLGGVLVEIFVLSSILISS